MKLIAFGGDARMLGALQAARRAGWETAYICSEDDLSVLPQTADAVLLPWPHSFRDDLLAGTQISKPKLLASLPQCSLIVHGGGVQADELPAPAFDPSGDDAFLRTNARLTAEGAIFAAMARQGYALLGATVLITGFGRIAQELTLRLAALGAFVIVCARSDPRRSSPVC